MLEALKVKYGPERYKSWFAALGLVGVNGKTAAVSVPTHFWRDWMNRHYLDFMEDHLKKTKSSVYQIDFVVKETISEAA